MNYLHGIRYVAPLREGGSLPAIVDTDDGRSFVVKFRGAGQGARALVAEVIVAQLALALVLPVPAPAIIDLGEGFGKAEPDPEIQDLLRGSVGLNFGLEYLPGAFGYDQGSDTAIDPELAAAIIWFDAFVLNVDRTPRNPNILIWDGDPWLIDHGAALYFHHGWRNWRARAQDPFTRIEEHVLLGSAVDPRDVDARLAPLLNDTVLREAVDAVPDTWLEPASELETAAEQREAYCIWFTERLHGPREWLETASAAWKRGPAPYARRLTHRVV